MVHFAAARATRRPGRAAPRNAHILPPDDTGADLTVPLRDGGRVGLRPLRQGEAAPLLAVFDGLSQQSRASRYLAGVPRLVPTMLRALTDVDGHDHIAWLASVAERPVGVARTVRTGPVTAEVALEVVDAEQGRGIGTVLLDAVTTVAAVHGIERVQAMVLPDNTPSRRLLQHLGIPLAWSGDALEGEGPLRLLTPPRLDRARVVALAARTRIGPDQASTTAPASSHWEGEGSINAGPRAG